MGTNRASRIEAMFAHGGPVDRALAEAGKPYARDEVQVAYAVGAAAILERGESAPGTVAFLEAETGVGKTLGYLIALGLHLHDIGRRGAVSTFTLQLQRQIVENDGPVAARALELALGWAPAIAPRKGLRNFVDPVRAGEAIGLALESVPAAREAAEAFLRWVAESEGGELEEWTETGGELPAGLGNAEVCLVAGRTSPAYEEHVARAESAEIAVVTHALLVAECRCRFGLFGDEDGAARALVVDEADALAVAAREAASPKVSLRTLRTACEGAVGRGKGIEGLSEALDDLDEACHALWQSARSGRLGDFHPIGAGGVAALDRRHAIERRAFARPLKQLALGLPELVRRCRRPEPRRELDRLAMEVGFLERMVADGTALLLNWSPSRRFASLSTIDADPGRLLGRIWNERRDEASGAGHRSIQSAVLTSATLGGARRRLPSDGSPVELASNDVLRGLGLLSRGRVSHELSARFTVRRFGEASFLLAGPGAPAPIAEGGEDEEAAALAPAWLDWAAEIIARAGESGGRVLVLTVSYSETELLASRLTDAGLGPRAIVQRRGQKLKSGVARFRALAGGIWITPVGWEGLDLPGLVDELVLTRLPFPPPDRPRASMDRFGMLNRGYGEPAIRSILYAQVHDMALRRLRQGLGRAIRRRTDRARIWILDRRFPLPDEVSLAHGLPHARGPFAPFAGCIPARFADAYADAELLHPISRAARGAGRRAARPRGGAADPTTRGAAGGDGS